MSALCGVVFFLVRAGWRDGFGIAGDFERGVGAFCEHEVGGETEARSVL